MAVSPPLTETQVPSAAPESQFTTKDFLQFGASLLALLSLLLFAMAYWAVTEYFGVFGLTPEQVGIDKQTLLTRRRHRRVPRRVRRTDPDHRRSRHQTGDPVRLA
ncbi:hypothetical protein ACIQI7_04685 [Kitasatospora sp. NPDC092039]|uniref:hypothetical protein n=1 Tax=Kitasatospora sp. NPDC092039 TaxID=3364086 RepID=UPI0038078693